jgi:hypothetical protein
MARVLYDGLVEYEDGTPANTSQMAKDVTNFLAWTSEPEHDQRKKMGLQVSSITLHVRSKLSPGRHDPFYHDRNLALPQAIQVDPHQEPKTVLQPSQHKIALGSFSYSCLGGSSIAVCLSRYEHAKSTLTHGLRMGRRCGRDCRSEPRNRCLFGTVGSLGVSYASWRAQGKWKPRSQSVRNRSATCVRVVFN